MPYYHVSPDGEGNHESEGQFGPGVYYSGNEADAQAVARNRGHSVSDINVDGGRYLTLQPGQSIWSHPDLWSDIDPQVKADIMNSALRSGEWAPVHTILRSKAYQGVRKLNRGGQIDNGMVMSPSLSNTTASSDMVLSEAWSVFMAEDEDAPTSIPVEDIDSKFKDWYAQNSSVPLSDSSWISPSGNRYQLPVGQPHKAFTQGAHIRDLKNSGWVRHADFSSAPEYARNTRYDPQGQGFEMRIAPTVEQLAVIKSLASKNGKQVLWQLADQKGDGLQSLLAAVGN